MSARASSPRAWIGRGVAVAVALLLAMASVVGIGQGARADTPGVTASMLYDGQPLQSGQMLQAGASLDLKAQYDNTEVVPGSTIDFTIGSNVTAASLPAANTSIASVTQTANADGTTTIAVTFKNPLPSDVNQGVFDIGLTVNDPNQSGPGDITWSLDTDQTSIPVIIKKQGDNPPPTTPASAKSVSPTDLNGYVSTAADGTVTVSPSVANQAIGYTLTLTSTAAQTVPISDQLPTCLSYDPGSFAATLTTWDSSGLNESTAPFPYAPTIAGSGDSFGSTVTVPGSDARDPNGPSILTITYTAHADASCLQTALQAALNGESGFPTGGTSATLALQNTATFGDQTDQATVSARATVPSGPCALCASLSKASSWDSRNVLTDANGNLTPPQEITYTLTARTSTTSATLPQNAVISDPLPSQAGWDTGDPQFITASGVALTEAADCPDATAFAGDGYVDQWCVSGQTLLVNLGDAAGTSASVNAKALVTSVKGLTATGAPSTMPAGANPYSLPNTASLSYGAATPVTASKTVTVVQLPADSGTGYVDSSVFSKTTPGVASVTPGQSAQIPYRFTVGAGEGIDLTKSTITDFIDQSVFGAVDPGTLDPTGTYNGQQLTAADFALSTDGSGNLVIALSGAGKAIVEAQGIDKAFQLNLTLTTLPFDGKVTKSITNSASLTGGTGQPPYTSTATESTTSYGSEAEVDKTLYDPATRSYTDTLQATTNGAATYVYKVDFIPHGGYNGIVISNVVDALPAGEQFLGFVTAADAPTASDPSQGPVDIGGNLEAVYDSSGNTMTIQQQSGTVLNDPSGTALSVYFAVTVSSLTGPIVNRIGQAIATIEPAPLHTGAFSIHKVVKGTGASSLPGGTTFTVHYSYPAGTGYVGGEGDLAVKADGTVTSPRLPAGALVSLAEKTPGAVTGATWGSPVFSLGATTIGTVRIGDGTTSAITLTNTLTSDTATVTLALTGSDPMAPLAVAALLIVIGAAVVLIVTRRRGA